MVETKMTNTEQMELDKRQQEWRNIDAQTWSSFEIVAPGIHVYHDVLPKELNIISTVEDYLLKNEDNAAWGEALVGYKMKNNEYRDCYDFKFKTSMNIAKGSSPQEKLLVAMYDETYFRQLQAVKHYCATYNISELRYWESTNFVKYGIGQHFAEHSDHGYSYNCTLSLVAYANDDFVGGELEFRLWNLKIKPLAGDLMVFPSNFMYPHRSLPVEEGTKYSLVTMLDYSDKFHNPKFYQETGT
jgi:hypothetical protein